MFKTDFNHLVQSLDSAFMSGFMVGVSELGMTVAILLVILVVTSGINFRKGILLMNIVGWMALATIGLKAYFDYPRPYAVDPTLQTYGSNKATAKDLRPLQPKHFFDDFSYPLLKEIRSREIGRRGFPSGHVILISGLYLGIALLFQKKWLWYMGITLVLLTMLSRIFLGVHYLGDVLGGLGTAVLLLLIFNYLIKRGKLMTSTVIDRPLLVLLFTPLVLLLLIPLLPVPAFQLGTLIGLNIAYFIILKRDGHPELAPGFKNRFLSVTIYVILYLTMYYGIKLLHLAKYGLWPVMAFTLANVLVILGIYLTGKKLRVYAH